MTGHVSGLLEADTVLVPEPTNPGSENDGSDKSRSTTSEVHDTAPCEVDHADPEQQGEVLTGGVGGSPALGGPDGADDNGVDETGEEGGVQEVGNHLAALGYGAGNDGSGSGSEGPL